MNMMQAALLAQQQLQAQAMLRMLAMAAAQRQPSQIGNQPFAFVAPSPVPIPANGEDDDDDDDDDDDCEPLRRRIAELERILALQNRRLDVCTQNIQRCLRGEPFLPQAPLG